MTNKKTTETNSREIPLNSTDKEMIRQNANYRKGNRPEPDNNVFFEERSNPLSSKGN